MKKVLVGICGGIASYKAINIISNLIQDGYEVEVVLSNHAHHFVSSTVIEALTKRKVHQDLFTEPLIHTALAQWCDLMVIVPATYNIVGKIASGIADDLLSTIISANTKQVILALAMNENMYNNPIFKHNINFLSQMGYQFIDADEGFLACNKYGKGRLKPEEEILAIIKDYFSNNFYKEETFKRLEYKNKHDDEDNLNVDINLDCSEVVHEGDNFYEDLVKKAIAKNQENEIININFVHQNKTPDSSKHYENDNFIAKNEKDTHRDDNTYQINHDLQGKNVVITAGRTLEYIDPVRYISSPSSGKMGWNLALECKKRGANVFLIIGENQLPKIKGIETIEIISADEMYAEVIKLYPMADVVIASAAVSDYKVKKQSINKIKKHQGNDNFNLELVENIDIIKELGKKKDNKILVGFCLETIDLEESALKKLKSKNLDFIVANNNLNLSSDNGDFHIITHDNKQSYTNITKTEIATIIVSDIVSLLHNTCIKLQSNNHKNINKDTN